MEFASAGHHLWDKIQQVSPDEFESVALEVFQHQARHNALYARYMELLDIDPRQVLSVTDIPFLPIRFFKNYEIRTGEWQEEVIFSSSGTTARTTSRHFVRRLAAYLENTRTGFEYFYGPPEGYCILALLPSYLERSGSSLIYMAEHFVKMSRYPQSGFFLYNTDELIRIIKDGQKKQIPILLLGVSFALLDLAEKGRLDLDGVIVMETGGMKGRRREITREELHEILMDSFGVPSIHSEYGMTELFSQAYSKGEGLFFPAPTMRVLVREVTDPLSIRPPGRSGAINIVDLANVDTISFIATDDLGRVYEDGSFEVLGRLDAGDIRGCNLLLEQRDIRR